jgi:hypothetical protein
MINETHKFKKRPTAAPGRKTTAEMKASFSVTVRDTKNDSDAKQKNHRPT